MGLYPHAIHRLIHRMWIKSATIHMVIPRMWITHDFVDNLIHNKSVCKAVDFFDIDRSMLVHSGI